MKLDNVQIYKVQEAMSSASSVCSQIKQKTLRGEDLKAMKILESAVSHLEIFLLHVRG